MRFYIFGDSICFGQYISPHETWAARLSAALTERFAATGLFVNNPSINGDTTRKALERMPHDVQAHAPDFCLVQFGMNDCNFWNTDNGLPRVSPRAFEANLIEILQRLCTFNVRTVFLNTNHPSLRTQRDPWAPMSYQDHNRQYNEIIRSVSQQFRDRPIILTDMEAIWQANIDQGINLSDLLLADGIHLSRNGHDLYLSALRPVVLDALS